MTRLEVVYGAFLAAVCVFLIGVLVGALTFAGNNGIDLAPNGMAYCPTDASTPHPTPCMFRQP